MMREKEKDKKKTIQKEREKDKKKDNLLLYIIMVRESAGKTAQSPPQSKL